MVEIADLRVAHRGAFQHILVQHEDARIGVEGAAALILPGAGDGGYAGSGVHVDRAVALASEAVAEAEVGFLGRADEMGEGLDFGDAEPGDGGSPFGCARPQMLFQSARVVGVFFEIGAIGHAIAEQDMHDRASECAIGAGLQDQSEIRLLHRCILVDVDDDDPGTAFLARLDGVGHHIDLRDHSVGAPDHHAVGFRHLARVGPAQGACPHHPAGPGQIGADRAEEA